LRKEEEDERWVIGDLGSPAACQGVAVWKASCKLYIAVLLDRLYLMKQNVIFTYLSFSCFEEKCFSLASRERSVSAWNKHCVKNKSIFNFKEHF